MAITFDVSKDAGLVVKAEIDVESKSVLLRFSGYLDEKSDLNKISKYVFGLMPGIEDVRLDVGEVTEINSGGAREWFEFIQRLQTIGIRREGALKCSFFFLSEVFVERASVFPDLLGRKGTEICSFEIPYFCRKCETRSLRKYRVSDFLPLKESVEAPAIICDSCQSPLIFDEDQDTYFNFLKRC